MIDERSCPEIWFSSIKKSLNKKRISHRYSVWDKLFGKSFSFFEWAQANENVDVR